MRSPPSFSILRACQEGKRRKATKGCYSFTSIAFFASLSLRQDVRYCVNILVASDTDSPSSSTARQKSCGVCCCSRRLDTPLARLICDSLKTGYCRLLRISDWGEGNVRCVVPVNTVEWLLCCSNQPWSSLSFLCRCVSVSLPSAWGLSCLGSECHPLYLPFLPLGRSRGDRITSQNKRQRFPNPSPLKPKSGQLYPPCHEFTHFSDWILLSIQPL